MKFISLKILAVQALKILISFAFLHLKYWLKLNHQMISGHLMSYNPEKHHRRSIRLKGYDYSQPGWYFVTICIQNREMILGNIENGMMILINIGKIINHHWQRQPHIFKNIELDRYQIMPNHLHGIIHIAGVKHSEKHISEKLNDSGGNASPLQPPHGTVPGSLGAIMQNFQSVTARKINKIRKTPAARLWQRNYYDHIIRDENDYLTHWRYIEENPMKWHEDCYWIDDNMEVVT